MSDLISRQAAIDALHMHLMYRMGTDSNKKRLDDWINGVPSAQPEKRTEERTETHSCDSIDRQAAIDVLKGLPTWWADAGGYYGGAQPPMVALLDPEDAVSAIENLPSEQPKRKWIPCSERLPEQYGNYLISIHGEDEPDIGTINPNDKRGWSLCDANGFHWASDKKLIVTAWMPLPEPYRGE